eukprot:366055-Chlamydomonas_euryale.AAC.8
MEQRLSGWASRRRDWGLGGKGPALSAPTRFASPARAQVGARAAWICSKPAAPCVALCSKPAAACPKPAAACSKPNAACSKPPAAWF